ncbi:MAG: hypothetical protein M4579_005828 [Chaenotheca gracillima]|nr:MAG: hypothetical protein M4579_005828 [Chaenotheca gracillima]
MNMGDPFKSIGSLFSMPPNSSSRAVLVTSSETPDLWPTVIESTESVFQESREFVITPAHHSDDEEEEEELDENFTKPDLKRSASPDIFLFGSPSNARVKTAESSPPGTRSVSKIGDTLEDFYKNLSQKPRSDRLPISCLRPERRYVPPFPEMLKTLHDSTNQDTASFPLMKLPAEIRERIYDFALVRYAVYPGKYREDHEGEAPSVNLLLASRQVYVESVRVLYERNVFSFGDMADLNQFTLNCEEFNLARFILSIELVPDVKEVYELDIDRESDEWWFEHARQYDELQNAWLGIEEDSSNEDDDDENNDDNAEDAEEESNEDEEVHVTNSELGLLENLQTVRIEVSRSCCHLCGAEDHSHELAASAVTATFMGRPKNVIITGLLDLTTPETREDVVFKLDSWSDQKEDKIKRFYQLMKGVKTIRKRQFILARRPHYA